MKFPTILKDRVIGEVDLPCDDYKKSSEIYMTSDGSALKRFMFAQKVNNAIAYLVVYIDRDEFHANSEYGKYDQIAKFINLFAPFLWTYGTRIEVKDL